MASYCQLVGAARLSICSLSRLPWVSGCLAGLPGEGYLSGIARIYGWISAGMVDWPMSDSRMETYVLSVSNRSVFRDIIRAGSKSAVEKCYLCDRCLQWRIGCRLTR
jgi:hypothetical protein